MTARFPSDMSNTKLTKAQKEYRKDRFCELLENNGEIGQVGQFTVAKMPEFAGSKMALFSVAYCSPNEKKFRPKVGEYFALSKMIKGEIIKLPEFFSAFDVADMFANVDEDAKFMATVD